MNQQQEEQVATILEGTENWRGLPFIKAVALAQIIMETPHWFVDGLQDRPFHPENWHVHAIYHPRKPNGRVSGSRVAKWVRSPEDWLAFQERAIELNTRNSRAATTRKQQQQEESRDT